MAYTREYSSADSTVSWIGNKLYGLAPDSGIVVTYNSDITDEEVGMQGNVATSVLPDGTGTVVLTFQQESEADKQLRDLVKRQKATKRILRGTLLIKLNTGEVIEAREAYIKSRPERGFGSTATGSVRAWTFFTPEIVEQSAESWGVVGETVNKIRDITDAVETLVNLF